ncbi:S-protein homolog 2 [Linum grandiflorum]
MKCSILITAIVLLLTVTIVTANAVVKADEEDKSLPTGLFKKTTVTITNNLEDTGAQLTLHCKSKDDDLGVQVLGHDQQFSFRFGLNFFLTTQFYCSFEWPNGGGRHWFDIYIASRDSSRCSECQWRVDSRGACLYNGESGAFDICYGWNKN